MRWVFYLMIWGCLASQTRADDAVPAATTSLQDQLRQQRDQLDARLKANPDDYAAVSARGDVRFFLGDFTAAMEDYDRMLVLHPEESASHWRRGIALFYASRPVDAAAQFEKYHSFDNVDRENGIWRYFSQVKAIGREKAQAELLRYEKDDRPPFPEVYKLFSGELSADQVMESINAGKRSETEQQSCEFYAHLYIGLNAAINGDAEVAKKHLELAVKNDWPKTAGYGPRYMWHVGRVHLELLNRPKVEL